MKRELGESKARATWVQTDRATHEAWGSLTVRKPRAAALAHYLVANMGPQNAVVISQTLLSKILNCSTDTINRAVRDLVTERWIQVVRLGKGKEVAYVVNSRVAWGQKRENLSMSIFSARVIADIDDQDPSSLDEAPLRKLPTLYPGELQMPDGPGENPPFQPALQGVDIDPPFIPNRG